jgi:hypothetical protein
LVLPFKLRRALAVCIPLFDALLFLGVFKAILGIDISTNIANTGITLGLVFGLLNLFLLYMAQQHLVP